MQNLWVDLWEIVRKWDLNFWESQEKSSRKYRILKEILQNFEVLVFSGNFDVKIFNEFCGNFNDILKGDILKTVRDSGNLWEIMVKFLYKL